MATIVEKLDSVGGFSIDKTTVVDELRNGKDFNTLEIKNSEYSDSKTTTYILRGLNTAVLQLDTTGAQIPIDNNTINFITGHIVGVNPAGLVYVEKIESVAIADGVGLVSVLGNLNTVVKDQIPNGQTWAVEPLGGTNRFSFNTTRAGTTNIIKWVASTNVVSIAWA